jgi:hypothetical protein
MPHFSCPFYNVRVAVGNNAPNNGDDVMMVQFMLMQIATDPVLRATAPDDDLDINGVFSPLLIDWITWFQEQCKAHGLPVFVDGRIDPLPGCSGSGFTKPAMQGFFHTIVHLNATFRRRFRDKHDRLGDQPELASIKEKFLADDYGTPFLSQ